MDSNGPSTLVRALLLVLCLCSPGCVHYSTPAERTASFSRYNAASVGQENLEQFLIDRSAVLVAGEQLRASSAGTNVQMASIVGTSAWRGNAAAIDRRGYFLTAAHCLAKGPFWLAFLHEANVQLEAARVVWRGDSSKEHPDLALLKVSSPLERVFQWATEFTNGSPILAVGSIRDTRSVVRTQCMAGKVLSLEDRKSSFPPSTLVYHDLPLRPGDSGGPLVSTDGRLVGINVAGEIGLDWSLSVRPVRYYAERPALEWLQEIMSQDAATISEVSPTAQQDNAPNERQSHHLQIRSPKNAAYR